MIFLKKFCLVISWLIYILCNIAVAQKVQLSWDQPISEHIAYYNIYKKCNIDTNFWLMTTISSLETTVIDENIFWDSRVYYVMTSIDPYGRESGYSNMVEVLIPAQVFTLNYFYGELLGDNFVLYWSGNGIDRVGHFEIQRSTTNSADFYTVQIVEAETGKAEYQYEFVGHEKFENSACYRLKIVGVEGEISYSESIKIDRPTTFELYQNYPNPFNASTTISYWLRNADYIELNIYNNQGQKVTTLVKQHQQAGTFKINWNGKTQKGTKLSSGLYYYKMITKNEVQAKRLILIN